MTTKDPFDAPDQRPCPRCRTGVLRVRDTETGLSIDLDLHPVPVTRTLPTNRPLFENHPHHGWHCQSSPQRRGYPIHLMHRCANTNESETTP